MPVFFRRPPIPPPALAPEPETSVAVPEPESVAPEPETVAPEPETVSKPTTKSKGKSKGKN